MEGNQEQPIAVRSRNEEDEEGEVEEEENECEPELPLSVQIEGKNRILSVAVISLTALVMDFLRSAGGVVDDARSVTEKIEDIFKHSVPVQRFFALFLWMITLSCYSGCVVCTMCTNTNPRKKGWMCRRVCSLCGLLFWNTFLIPALLSNHLDTDDDLNTRPGEIDIAKIKASAYVLLLFAVFIAVNLGFIILPCFWSPLSQHPSSEELPVGIVVDEGHSEGTGTHTSDELPVPPRPNSIRATQEVPALSKDNAIRDIQHTARPLRTWNTIVFRERAELECSIEPNSELPSELESTEVGWTRRILLHWRILLNNAWKSVKEEGDRFHYSVWVIASVVVSVVLLFKNMKVSIEYFQGLALAIQNAAESTLESQRVQEESDLKVISALEKAQTLIDGAEGLFSELLTSANLSNFHPEVQSIVQQLSEFNKFTAGDESSWLDKITNILDEKMGINFASSPTYFSEYSKVLNKTVVVGFLFGTAIGLHAVYTVLAAHKKMSIQLIKEMRRSDDRGSGFGIEQKYPIGRAVFFLGVMVSTALVQQTILGIVVSLVLGVIFTYKGYSEFMQFGGYRIVALIVTIIINQLIIIHLGNKRLSDGYKVKHPVGFLLYMCIFSMLHFVLGIYYALFRLVWLLITTFLILSRLDVTIFANGKRFDNGHNAFMATLLLTRVIQQNIRETRVEESTERDQSGRG